MTTMHQHSDSSSSSKRYWIFEHIWKTGGNGICELVKANGLHVPDNWGCYATDRIPRVNVSGGWPRDAHGRPYEMVSNEVALPEEGPITPIEMTAQEGSVGWLTMLRHPYDRSMSHYEHAKKSKVAVKTSLQVWLEHPGPNERGKLKFNTFLPDQQTRWICGRNCTRADPSTILPVAMKHLRQFDVVLLLEDLDDPNSCSRLQMRHILKWIHPEVLSYKASSAAARKQSKTNPVVTKNATTWLDKLGAYTNVPVERNAILAALAKYNSLDLQLYGYARLLCQEIAESLVDQDQARVKVSLTNTFVPDERHALELCFASVLVLLLLCSRMVSRRRIRRED